MAWGRGSPAGIDDLVKRVADNDAKLQSLTILRFRRLNDSDVEALATALQCNSTLQELNCSSHSITAKASGALGSMLQQNRALKRISIGNSSWGDQALAALAQGLVHNTTLETWDLEHKGLTSEAAGSILEVLQAQPTLQQLLLSRNALTDAGVSGLCAGPWKSLKLLELVDCGLTAQAVSALAAAAGLANLQELDLSHNHLGPGAGEVLGQLLRAAGQLLSLKLRSTALGGTGVAGLAKGLQCSKSLCHLDLSYTQLTDAGLEALAAALAGSSQQLEAAAPNSPHHQPPLQQLYLGGNPDLTDTALSNLAAALAAAAGAASSSEEQPPPQQQQPQQGQQRQWQLDLAETGAGAGSVKALSGLSGLTQLSLFGCKLGTAGGAAGQDAPINTLQACITNGSFASLQGLNLSGCTLSYEQLTSLFQKLASDQAVLPSLKTLEVGANPGVQHDGFEAEVVELRGARRGLDVHWRVADSDAPPQQ